MSNIIVLSGSPRKGGNTDLLVDAFVKGAEKNNNVEVVSVADYKVNPCIGCNSCFDRAGHECFQQDDMQIVYDKLKCADVIVVASPVYFYGVSAQLKAIIDRLHTSVRNDFKVKKLMNQKICMPVEDCFISIIELKPVEDKILNKYGRMRRVFLQEHNPILFDNLTLWLG